MTTGNTTDIPPGQSDPPPLCPAPARVSISVLLIGESPGSVSCWWLQSPSGCPPSCRRHYLLARCLWFLGSESFDTLRQRYVGSVAAIRAAISTNQSRVTPKLLQGNAPCAICRHMLAPSSQPVTVFSPERFDFMEAKLRFAQNGLSVSQLLEALLETGPRPGAWRGESDWFHFTWTGFAIQLDSNSRRPATRPRFAGGKRRQILAPKRLLLLALGESDR